MTDLVDMFLFSRQILNRRPLINLSISRLICSVNSFVGAMNNARNPLAWGVSSRDKVGMTLHRIYDIRYTSKE